MGNDQASGMSWLSAMARFGLKISSKQLFLLCVGLALVVFALYTRTAENQFITTDDDIYITNNILVNHGISLGRVLWVFSHKVAGQWHSVTWVSHMLDVELFGLNPGAHHLVNAAFHALNAALLLFLLFRLTGSLWCSAFAAALFAFHPLRVESVAWAAERKDVLSGMFWMLTLLAYQRYTACRSVPRYLLVALYFSLGLLAKPMLVTIPCVLLLLDYWPLREMVGARKIFGLILEKVPLFILAVVASKLTIASQIDTLESYPLGMLSFGARFSNAVTSYAQYLWKFVWPTDLAIFYPHPALVSPETFTPYSVAFLASLTLLLFLSVGVLSAIRSFPYLAVGWFWFLGTLMPVIGFAQVGAQAFADRYSYLPMIGICIMIAWVLRDLVLRWPNIRDLVSVAACVVLLVLSCLSWIQTGYWRDSRTLFEHALEVTENNFFAHANLAVYFQREGNSKQAIEQAKEAIRIRPGYANAHHLLGSEYEKQGKRDQAIEEMESAVRWAAWNPQYMCDLGSLYQSRGRLVEAQLMFERAIEVMPEYTSAHLRLGSLLASGKNWERAEREFERALELAPRNVDASFGIGVALLNRGQVEPSIRAFESTLRLAPAHKQVYCALGMAYEQKGEEEAATTAYRKALGQRKLCEPARRWFRQGREQ